MGGNGVLSVGDYLIRDNHVTMTGDDGNGIVLYIYYMLAKADYSNASVMTGAMSAVDNVVSMTGDGNFGIFLRTYNTDSILAACLGDHDFDCSAYAEVVGGVNIENNLVGIVGAYSTGIYLSDFQLNARSMDYNANATLKMDISVTGNFVGTTNQGSGWTHGIYLNGYTVQAGYDRSFALAESVLLIDGNEIMQSGANTCGIHLNEVLRYNITYSSFIGMAWIHSAVVVAEELRGGRATSVCSWTGAMCRCRC